MQEYTFDIKHRPGIKHQNCDALSRRPYPDQNISQNKNAFSQDDDLLPSEKTEITFIYANENYEEILKMTEHVTENEKVTINVLSDQPQIKVEQQNCPYLKHIYEYIQQGVLPADKNRAKAIPYEANQYEIINDVLYHIFQPRTKNKEKTEVLLKQLAVPEKLRNDVIKSYHDSIAGGCHLGVQRTYVAIKQKYFWPKMYQNIYDYVTSCDICQRVKRETSARNAPLHPLPVQGTFDRWHMDILAGLPKTKQGYQYILLVTDSLSHWSEALPMKTQEATEVAHLLYKEIFTRYGAPRTLVSDRGQNFMSNIVQILCKIFQVTRHVTSSYHPQSNVACERINSTLAQSLRAYCQKEQTHWDSVLPSILIAFRMSPSTQSTGFSPYYMVFGKEMSLPLDVALLPSEELHKAPDAYVKELIYKVKIIQEIAQQNVKDVQKLNKQRYDKKTKEPQFQIRDQVLLKIMKRTPEKKHKLQPKWEGPYYIIKVNPNHSFRLRRCDNHIELKSSVHANRLKLYKDPRDFRPPPVNDNNGEVQSNNQNDVNRDDVNKQNGQNNAKDRANQDKDNKKPNGQWHEVEKLLKSKYMNNKRHYLVKWADGSKPTWEPSNNVSQFLKQLYHSSVKQRKRKRY